MTVNHHGNVQPLLDNEEHEHNYEPATKRVLPYGWDGSAKRTLNVDSSGQLNVNVVSGTAGLATVSILNADEIGLATVNINNTVNALATVNVSNTVSGIVTVANFSSIGVSTVNINNTINALATVNVSNVLNAMATVILKEGISQIGSVTVSNASSIGLATVDIRNTVNALATVNVSNNINVGNFSGSTIYAVVNTAAAGQASIVLDTGSKWVGLATVNVSNVIGSIVTVAPRTDYIGLASVSGNVVNLSGTAQIGSVTVSSIGPGTATIGIIRSIMEEMGGKVFTTSPIAITATNLSGSTVLVSSANKRFYVTNVWLSTASTVGVNFLSGATYLTGNASVRMNLAPQSGVIDSGTIQSPILHALADQQNLLLVTDTASPISGKVVWYEE